MSGDFPQLVGDAGHDANWKRQRLMRIVFISRRYPPSVGGIQTFSYNLHRQFARDHQVTLIALGRDHPVHLGWFVPTSALRALAALVRGADVVYFTDGVISAIAPLLRPFARRARLAVTVQGLEVTYANPVLSRIIRRGIAACDVVIAGSENTRSLMDAAGIPASRTRAIYCGVEPTGLDPVTEEHERKTFTARTGVRLGEEPVLLNIGRQVPRKGLAEFLTDVVPLLDPVPAIVICGTGPEHERLKGIADRSPHRDRIHLVGFTSDDTTTMLRRASTLFLMPNIHVPGDAEGFGIAPLEAMYDGLPVVGYAVDALPESLREGSWLIRPGDAQGYADAINAALRAPRRERESKRAEAMEYVRREYGWQTVAANYLEWFRTAPR